MLRAIFLFGTIAIAVAQTTALVSAEEANQPINDSQAAKASATDGAANMVYPGVYSPAE